MLFFFLFSIFPLYLLYQYLALQKLTYKPVKVWNKQEIFLKLKFWMPVLLICVFWFCFVFLWKKVDYRNYLRFCRNTSLLVCYSNFIQLKYKCLEILKSIYGQIWRPLNFINPRLPIYNMGGGVIFCFVSGFSNC